MKMSDERQSVSLKRIISFAIVCCLVSFCLILQLQASPNPVQSLDGLIRNADTTYWLGQAEKGDVRLFQKGINSLDEASSLLVDLSKEDQAKQTSRIDSLRQELEEQMDMAHDTLWGVFPLLRFAIFKADNWEWLDNDMKVVAVGRATQGLRSTLIENWRNLPQMDVTYAATEFFNGVHIRSQALENEAAYLMNENPKFFNHNALEISSSLSPEESGLFYKEGIDRQIGDKLCSAFGVERLVEFRIEEIDRFDSDHFFIAKAAMFEKGAGITADRSFAFGFSRDATNKVWWIAVPFLFSFLGAVFLHLWLRTDNSLGKWHSSFAYVCGFSVVLIGLGSVAKLLPMAEMIVKYGFWYIILCGFLLLSTPLLAGIVVTKKLVGARQAFSGNDWFVALLPYSLGSIGFCAYPAFTYLSAQEGVFVWLGVLLVAMNSALLVAQGISNSGGSHAKNAINFSKLSVATVFGVAWYLIPGGDKDSLTTLAMVSPVVLALISFLRPTQPQAESMAMGFVLATLGGVFFLTGSQTLAIALAAPCLLAIPIGLRGFGARNDKVPPCTVSDSALIDKQWTGQCLSERLRSAHDGTAPFTTYDGFSVASAFIREAATHKSLRFVRITGVGGSGKSRVARELVKECFHGKCVLLEAECDVSQGQAIPYSSLAHVLEQTGSRFESDGNGHGGLVFDELCGILENIIPMGGLIKGTLISDAGKVAPTSGEVAHSLAQRFAHWTDYDEYEAVVLLVDNADKIDQASLEVIQALLEQYVKMERTYPLAVIECGRESVINLERRGLSLVLEPKFITSRFLGNTMGLDTTLSQEAEASAGHPLRPLEMIHWVENARKAGFLKESPLPFARAQPPGIPFPAPPEEVFHSIEELVGELSTGAQTTLEHAACIGLEFDISALVVTRGLPKHDILEHLSETEKPGLSMDILGRDGIYRFNSPITLETMLRRLGYQEKTGLRQRALETHKLLADHYSNDRGNNLFLATKHACLGGENYALKAAGLCYKSALQSFRLNAFKDAAGYAEKALELTKTCVTAQEELRLDAYTIWLRAQEAFRTKPELEDTVGCRAFLILEEVRGGAITSPCKYVTLVAKLGIILGKCDRIEEAFRLLDEVNGLQVFERLPRLLLGHSMAFLNRIRDNYGEAVELLQNAIQEFGDASDADLLHKQYLAEALNTLGDTKTHLGDLKTTASGISDIRASLEIKKDIGDKFGQALSLGSIGRHYLFSKDDGYFQEHSGEAAQAFKENLNLSEEIGNFTGQIKMPCFLGQCFRRSGLFDDAVDWFGKAVDQARKHESKPDLAFALSGLAQTYHKIGNFEHRDQHGHELANLYKDLSDQQKSDLMDEISWVKELDGEEWATGIHLMTNECGLD